LFTATAVSSCLRMQGKGEMIDISVPVALSDVGRPDIVNL